jgi:hypothetical protein
MSAIICFVFCALFFSWFLFNKLLFINDICGFRGLAGTAKIKNNKKISVQVLTKFLNALYLVHRCSLCLVWSFDHVST